MGRILCSLLLGCQQSHPRCLLCVSPSCGCTPVAPGKEASTWHMAEASLASACHLPPLLSPLPSPPCPASAPKITGCQDASLTPKALGSPVRNISTGCRSGGWVARATCVPSGGSSSCMTPGGWHKEVGRTAGGGRRPLALLGGMTTKTPLLAGGVDIMQGVPGKQRLGRQRSQRWVTHSYPLASAQTEAGLPLLTNCCWGS